MTDPTRPIEKMEFHNLSTKTANNNMESSSTKPLNENFSIIKGDQGHDPDMIASVRLKLQSTTEEQASQNVSQHESCYIQVSDRIQYGI